jgi:hypothetical protein
MKNPEVVDIDLEENRKKHTRSLAEFNEMNTSQKVSFIQNGGQVV